MDIDDQNVVDQNDDDIRITEFADRLQIPEYTLTTLVIQSVNVLTPLWDVGRDPLDCDDVNDLVELIKQELNERNGNT